MEFAIVIIWPYFYCNSASLTIDRISDIQNTIYDLPWYDMPLETRKYLILIMGKSQNPIYFMGYGLIRCTLENFGKVSNHSLAKKNSIWIFQRSKWNAKKYQTKELHFVAFEKYSIFCFVVFSYQLIRWGFVWSAHKSSVIFVLCNSFLSFLLQLFNSSCSYYLIFRELSTVE